MSLNKLYDGTGKQYDIAAGAKGDKGDKGDTGATGAAGSPGYTPVKGTDYWTAADQAQMVADVLAALPTYQGEVEDA